MPQSLSPMLIASPDGGTFYGCPCLAEWWPKVQQKARERGFGYLTVTQGCYSASRVRASASTHDGGGVLDIGEPRQDVCRLLRDMGAAAWVRTRADGFTPHIHMVLIGCPHVDPSAARQITSYRNERNGLASNARDRDPYRPSPIPTWQQAIRPTLTDTIRADLKEAPPMTDDEIDKLAERIAQKVTERVWAVKDRRGETAWEKLAAIRTDAKQAANPATPWRATWGGIPAMTYIARLIQGARK